MALSANAARLCNIYSVLRPPCLALKTLLACIDCWADGASAPLSFHLFSYAARAEICPLSLRTTSQLANKCPMCYFS